MVPLDLRLFVAFIFEDVCREELRGYLLSNGICAEYGGYRDKDGINPIALDRKDDGAYVAGHDEDMIDGCGDVSLFDDWELASSTGSRRY